MGREIVVITGMSGAGRSTVAHAMEDHGWYVIDNLPPSLLIPLFDLTQSSDDSIAVVIDVRGRQFFDDLNKTLAELAERGISRKIIFVDASDDVLVRRFESSRRPHPLQGSDRILDGIEKERERLRELRSGADLVVDSSQLNVHQLERKIAELFSVDPSASLKVNVLSFGYKFGLPVDADLVMDCRFIPNPHWVPELQPLSGQDGAVAKMVLDNPATKEFINNFLHLFNGTKEGFLQEGKRYLTIAIGCTGGRHRSVAVSEFLTNEFRNQKIDTTLNHRDLDR